ncbi:hypothetical protein M0811_08009 [Anaeramoeba ignava]|uniref:Transmembrane protein n=1 Tax=Anaeramoeba ignava TaxID=1746090 RepID=A0A9Q0RDF0_ANAIG|nr:hypothetical protein M0811_08009 [Anaeramoeba ignava]
MFYIFFILSFFIISSFTQIIQPNELFVGDNKLEFQTTGNQTYFYFSLTKDGAKLDLNIFAEDCDQDVFFSKGIQFPNLTSQYQLNLRKNTYYSGCKISSTIDKSRTKDNTAQVIQLIYSFNNNQTENQTLSIRVSLTNPSPSDEKVTATLVITILLLSISILVTVMIIIFLSRRRIVHSMQGDFVGSNTN